MAVGPVEMLAAGAPEVTGVLDAPARLAVALTAPEAPVLPKLLVAPVVTSAAVAPLGFALVRLSRSSPFACAWACLLASASWFGC